MNVSNRKLHKFIGLVVSVQLLLWTISGIFFSFNKIDQIRGENYLKSVEQITPQKIIEKNKPEEILKLAVKRMLPGGVLSKNQLKKLKIYSGEQHPHSAQNPQVLDLAKMNSKNIIRN